MFDPEHTGTIGVGQLRYILTNLGEKLSDQEVDELLAGAKVGSDGNIDYRAFVREVLRGRSARCGGTGLTVFFDRLCPPKLPQSGAPHHVVFSHPRTAASSSSLTHWPLCGIPLHISLMYDTARQPSIYSCCILQALDGMLFSCVVRDSNGPRVLCLREDLGEDQLQAPDLPKQSHAYSACLRTGSPSLSANDRLTRRLALGAR